jgi:hypothetical protein
MKILPKSSHLADPFKRSDSNQMVTSASNLRPSLVLSPLGSMCQLFFQHGGQSSFPGSHSSYHFSLSRNQMTQVLQSRSFSFPTWLSALLFWLHGGWTSSKGLETFNKQNGTPSFSGLSRLAMWLRFQLLGETSKIKWAGICSSVTRRECFHSCFMFHVSSAARLRLDSASSQVLLKTF